MYSCLLSDTVPLGAHADKYHILEGEQKTSDGGQLASNPFDTCLLKEERKSTFKFRERVNQPLPYSPWVPVIHNKGYYQCVTCLPSHTPKLIKASLLAYVFASRVTVKTGSSGVSSPWLSLLCRLRYRFPLGPQPRPSTWERTGRGG